MSTENLCVERMDTYADMTGYVFSESRASATSKLNAISGHRAARGILRIPQAPGQPLTSGTPDVSVRGELPVASQGENLREAKHWLQLFQFHLRGSFRNARAHRSPCCTWIDWRDISRIVRRASPSGRIIRDIRPQYIAISEDQYCNKLDDVQMLLVII